MKLDLGGTGLRVIAEGDTVTLAVPKDKSLSPLLKK